jgi:hypothetical protein
MKMTSKSYLQIFFVVIIFVFSNAVVNGQTPISSGSPNQSELQTHKLNWINSKNDFDQDKYTEAQTELEIAYLINKSRINNEPILNIDIPINEAKLSYEGHKKPNETKLFDGSPVSNNLSNSINKNLHIYKYGNFYISTEEDKAVDQLNVFYTIRAINILRYRYPDAYQKLFVETTTFPETKPKLGDFVNRYKAFWITFTDKSLNNTDFDVAVSHTHLIESDKIPSYDNKDVRRFVNVSIIHINKTNILGKNPDKGSRLIYGLSKDDENYLAYMRDGLIETLFHEMLHRYIDYLNPTDQRFVNISNNRNNILGVKTEEAALINTSYPYFLREGGLSDKVPTYYFNKIFNNNITELKANNLLEKYANIFSDNTNNTQEAFTLGIFD